MPTSCSTCTATSKRRCICSRTPTRGPTSSHSRAISTRRLRCSRSISIGNPFDEIHSFSWSELRARYGERYPIPNGSISVTIELRGQADVSYAFAERDANAIVEYLTFRGVIDGTPAPLPELAFQATPFSGSEPLVAPISGVLVFRAPLGVWVEPGEAIADIVDPLTGRVVTITNSVAGVLYARQRARFATAGLELACVAGAEPIRSGSLLPN
ncbi:putative deacylase [Paraburkholderia youngii]